MELPAEYGLFALSRTSLGFFLGVALRRKRVDREINLRRYYISILLIGLALYIGSKSTFAILLGIPPFMILILETSFMKEIKISHHMKIVMQFLGRNSFGIYVWQIPVNSILQSESIISALNLRPVGVMTQLLVVFSKLITVLIISELTTRFFDTPIQRFLTKKLNHKFDKIPNISS
jgi:peptidoglycan/LPS O-acetylase OafA/YrhL